MRHTLFPAPGFIQIAFCGGGGGAPAPTPPPPREETDTPSAYDPAAALKRYDVRGTDFASGVKDLFKTPEAIPEDLSGWKVTGGRRNYSLEFKDGTSIPLTLSKYDDEQSRIQQLVDNLGAARGDYQAYSTYQADQQAAAAAEAKRVAGAKAAAQAAAEAKRVADAKAAAEAKRVAAAQAAADRAATAKAKRIADEKAAVAATQAKLDAAKTAYGGLKDTYTTTMEEMTKLQSDFDNLFSDYSALGTDKSSLQGAYDDMMGQYTSLEDTLATTRDQMAGLQGDYSGLQSSFDNLQTDYGLTSEQLAKSLEDASNLRQERQVMQTQNFLQGAEADKARRMEAGSGGIGSFAPAQAQYTQAQDAMSETALDPMSYSMAPIDFTGGMDNNIFNPTQFSAPGPDAASGYTDIFSGPSMGLTQYGYDYGANFNPYFDALNEQYGIPMTGVKR